MMYFKAAAAFDLRGYVPACFLLSFTESSKVQTELAHKVKLAILLTRF